jgi:preprotein translocase subunit SecD
MRRLLPVIATLLGLVVICTGTASAGQAKAAEPAPPQMAQSATRWLHDRLFGSPAPANDAAAALARRGGSRVLLKADSDDLRASMLDALRAETRGLLREARVPYSGLFVRDGSVEVKIRESSDLPRALSALAATAGTQASGAAVDVRDVGEGLLRLSPTQSAVDDRLRGALDQAIDIIKRRTKELGVDAAAVQRDGPDRILVLLPGVKDPTRLAMLSARGLLTFRLIDASISVDEALHGGGTSDSEVVYAPKSKVPYVVMKRVEMDGRDMLDAAPGFDQRTQDPIVNFRFTARGTRDFGRITGDNVGRPLAIVIDNAVVATPVIREPILGGSGQISGGFTLEEANDLAILLRTGMLPVNLVLIEQHTVEAGQKE